MATATPRIVEIEKVVVEEQRDGVVLELSAAEAKTLAAICARVGGSPDKSPRGHVGAIDAALRSAGYNWLSREAGADAYALMEGNSSLRFKDGEI